MVSIRIRSALMGVACGWMTAAALALPSVPPLPVPYIPPLPGPQAGPQKSPFTNSGSSGRPVTNSTKVVAQSPCERAGRRDYHKSAEEAYLLAHRNDVVFDTFIVKELGSTPEKATLPNLARWSADAGVSFEMLAGPLLGAYYVKTAPMNGYAAIELRRRMLNRDEGRGCLIDYFSVDLPLKANGFALARPNDEHYPKQTYLFPRPSATLPQDYQGMTSPMSPDFPRAWEALDTWRARHALERVQMAIVDAYFGEVQSLRPEIEFQHVLDFSFSHRLLAQRKTLPPCDFRPNDPSVCHGLSVASIMMSNTNNQMGMAGALRRNEFQVFDIAALDGGPTTNSGGTISALVYAAGGDLYITDRGEMAGTRPVPSELPGRTFTKIPPLPRVTRVINLSVNLETGACTPLLSNFARLLKSKGIVLVAAAGNAGEPGPDAPASCDGVINVVAHTASGQLASWSNKGKGREGWTISAPGEKIFTQAHYNGGSSVIVRGLSGTSYAAPLVSATVAMMLAVNPRLTVEDIRRILVNTGTKMNPRLNPYPVLDAGKAVQQVMDELDPGELRRRRLEANSSGDYEAGPIWSNVDAQGKCPGVCQGKGMSWNLNWHTTVPGRMSVCGCNQGNVSVPTTSAWPSPRVPVPTTSAWPIAPVSNSSPAAPQRGRSGDYQAGPIWSNADAQGKCPAVCTSAGLSWNRNWTTTVPGQMSVCGCQ